MTCALVLFTRELRVRDQQALRDRELLAGSAGAPNRLAFLRDCLRDLGAGKRSGG